jgi:hypothetical protein
MSRGERIADRYELCTPIGHGAMGEVWECTDLRLKRQVALKFIRPELLGSGDERQRFIRRFRREAAALAGVDHPHVATVHDAGEWKTMQYLVMQLVPGVATVADLVAEHGPLAVEATAAAGAQIVAGLSAVHAAGLVQLPRRPAGPGRAACSPLQTADDKQWKLIGADVDDLQDAVGCNHDVLRLEIPATESRLRKNTGTRPGR